MNKKPCRGKKNFIGVEMFQLQDLFQKSNSSKIGISQLDDYFSSLNNNLNVLIFTKTYARDFYLDIISKELTNIDLNDIYSFSNQSYLYLEGIKNLNNIDFEKLYKTLLEKNSSLTIICYEDSLNKITDVEKLINMKCMAMATFVAINSLTVVSELNILKSRFSYKGKIGITGDKISQVLGESYFNHIFSSSNQGKTRLLMKIMSEKIKEGSVIYFKGSEDLLSLMTYLVSSLSGISYQRIRSGHLSVSSGEKRR